MKEPSRPLTIKSTLYKLVSLDAYPQGFKSKSIFVRRVTYDEKVSVMQATISKKFLFFIKFFSSFLKTNGSSFFEAITLGGVGG
jgi:hypothetical protein